ncbi:MAG TPA: hypothetical protein VKC17_09680 [Sphingomicrobium sp.]|nr:hypothetical protein [Sphingomicrobium sp.]
MKWTRPRLGIAAKLHAIERARRSAAEADLMSARKAADEADEAAVRSQELLGEAEREWNANLASPGFSLELQFGLGHHLIARERDLQSSDRAKHEARDKLEQSRGGWQQSEANVRSGELVLHKGRRALSKRTDEARDNALSERTTWKWFRQ